MKEAGGQLKWSGWEGSHIGWVRKEVSSVSVAEGVLRPKQQGKGGRLGGN